MPKRETIVVKGVSQFPSISQAVRAGDFIWTAGILGVNPISGTIPDDLKTQTRNALDNLKSILEAAGSSLASVLKVNIFLRDISDRPAVFEVYGEYFSHDPPGRTTIGNAGFDGNALIEIEMVAIVDPS
jgi:2-iminobutanoate/2-iminopropanoate deaminase